MNKYLKVGVIILGAALGYAYYHFIGCSSGVCPLTSNPFISTGYGALLGTVIALGGKNQKRADSEKEDV